MVLLATVLTIVMYYCILCGHYHIYILHNTSLPLPLKLPRSLIQSAKLTNQGPCPITIYETSCNISEWTERTYSPDLDPDDFFEDRTKLFALQNSSIHFDVLIPGMRALVLVELTTVYGNKNQYIFNFTAEKSSASILLHDNYLINVTCLLEDSYNGQIHCEDWEVYWKLDLYWYNYEDFANSISTTIHTDSVVSISFFQQSNLLEFPPSNNITCALVSYYAPAPDSDCEAVTSVSVAPTVSGSVWAIACTTASLWLGCVLAQLVIFCVYVLAFYRKPKG